MDIISINISMDIISKDIITKNNITSMAIVWIGLYTI